MATCRLCNGRGRVPLPRGMSYGFYRFMGAGIRSEDDGSKLMLCECQIPPIRRDEDDRNEKTPTPEG